MILILLLAVVVLLPLTLWHDWIDNYEMRNPEKGQTLRNTVAYVIAIGLVLWMFSYVEFY